MENTNGLGTADMHWRESVLGNELMTGFVDFGPQPLSAITIASLAAMGYSVNPAEADAYTLPAFATSRVAGGRVALHRDVAPIRLGRLGPDGRVSHTIR